MGHEISPGTAAAAAGQRCGSEILQLLEKTSVVRELQLCSCFGQDDADAGGLLGQPQEVAIYPC